MELNHPVEPEPMIYRLACFISGYRPSCAFSNVV